MNIHDIVEKQREYFNSGATLSVKLRIESLRKLYAAIKDSEAEVLGALKADLGKSDFEGYMCEVGMTLSEISHTVKHLPKYAKEKTVRTPTAQFKSRSYVKPVPYGTTLIMSPWNYPFLLTVEPLVSAVAAGNTAIVKPSAYSPATSAVMEKLIKKCFPPEHVSVVTGGRKENSALLDEKFDFVFFTGSQAVGKEVLRHTAENLTPAVLELGGKSPCIVDETAKLELAARRIVFGKYLNCGQTCVAPDYILCHRSVKDRFVEAVKREIVRQFGEEPLKNPNYGRIVNRKHFDRICGLIDPGKTVHGGAFAAEELKIAPTVMDGVTFDDAVMGEEIFGPVMPVLTYGSNSELMGLLKGRQKPLAMYVFSESRENIELFTLRLPFGGGCVNDVIIHLATSELPFGGVGESGMGAYHGKYGFDTFSHRKAIVDKKTWLDLPMRYQPYSKKNEKAIRMFLK